MFKRGKNDICYCGSGKKYARCHYREDELFNRDPKLVKKFPRDAGMYRFDQFCPEVATTEGEAFWALDKDPAKDKPYFVAEYYCTNPDCDCNRVMLGVVDLEDADQGPLVSIGYSFDREDPEAGPYIDPLNRVTKEGKELFSFVEEILQSDREYVEILRRHYRMVKVKVSQGSRLVH